VIRLSSRPPRFFDDFDLELAVRQTPETARTKGMFFSPLQEVIKDWPALVKTLQAPPRGGKYHAFADYVSRDHVRLIDAAARSEFPTVPTREAHRLFGTKGFREFSRTMVGRVALSLVGSDWRAALRRFPEGYALLVSGTGTPEVADVEGDGMRIELKYAVGVPEYMCGILEEIVRWCGGSPVVELEDDAEGGVRAFVVRGL
jgi:uncharacterized protein (TIGR02265 family)